MLFAFSDEQEGFRDAVRGLLSKQMTPAHLRAAWDSGHDYRSELWPALVALGLPELTVPLEAGGAGGTFLDLALPLEECGYRCVPEPVVETLLVVPSVVAAYGDSDEARTWLDRIATGDARAAVALTGAGLVADGGTADVVLVREEDELHLVPAEAVTAHRLLGTDPTRRLAECTFQTGPGTLLTRDPAAGRTAADLAAAGTAGLLTGLSQHLLDTTRDYLLQREQFGVRIGTFQALKHRLADVAVALEAGRSLYWNAAYRLAVGDADASTAASLAKGAANHAAHLANSAALQLHGGIGFTWEHDLHLWLQRGQALEAAFGSTAHHRERVGELRLRSASDRTPTTT